MKITKTDLPWIVPASLVFGAILSSLQPGDWLTGLASFSIVSCLFLITLKALSDWSLCSSPNMGKTLAGIIALTFVLRLLVGVSLYLSLPVYGYEDADDKAGFIFTDAHRRDAQAWELAVSERPIVDAFSKKFAYDQYGGLLAFSALVYRYLSPDAHRVLLLVLLSAAIAALGIPFLWRAVNRVFGARVSLFSAWVFALYPESILLGSNAMREPYLLTFSVMALCGFVDLFHRNERSEASEEPNRMPAVVWLVLGLLGMLLISPAVVLAMLVSFAGWMWFMGEGNALSWKSMAAFVIIFFAGLFFLSTSLNRTGEFNASSPLSVVNDWLRLAVKWNAYGIQRDSGWVQKLFDEMPQWMRLPFIALYGILQPVLPAALIAPAAPIWKFIYILRAAGWYVLLPVMILSFGAGAGQGSVRMRNIILWLALLTWTWILLSALRAGGDQWDNPRYRTLLFLWQAILAGVVYTWWREKRSLWFMRVIGCEAAFLFVFLQWYASRYFHWGGQLPFPVMVGLIAVLWALILGMGWWRDRRRSG